MFLRPLLLGLLTLTLLGSGCRKSEVTAYTVPKEQDSDPHGPAPHSHDTAGNPIFATATPAPAAPAAAAPASNNMAAATVPTADGPGLTWTAPAPWKLKPAAPMRKATYGIPGDGGAEAELTITAFPNDVGGEAANLNRWRSQVKLPPAAEAELASQVTRSTVNGLSIVVGDFANPQVPASPGPQRILGAIVPVPGGTWFFKLSGSDAQLTKEKPAFLAFLQSVKPVAP
ncbi:MAG: hypothetical protein ABIY47_06725 [Opitutaceae bacterium]